MSEITMPNNEAISFKRASHIPFEVASRNLISGKLTARQRKDFKASRTKLGTAIGAESKTEQDRYCAMLKTLPLAKLERRATQAKHRATKAAHLLTKLAPASRFRPAMEQEVARQMYRLSWVEAEIEKRLGSKPKAKPAAFTITPEQIAAAAAAAMSNEQA